MGILPNPHLEEGRSPPQIPSGLQRPASTPIPCSAPPPPVAGLQDFTSSLSLVLERPN
jgi:hypothetical protein